MSDLTPCDDRAYWAAPPDSPDLGLCPECGEEIAHCACPCCDRCGELCADCRCPSAEEVALGRHKRQRAAVLVADEMYGHEENEHA